VRTSAAHVTDQTVSSIWRVGGAVLGQTALLTALLVYFGWARTRATFAYFGVDVGLLDLSTTDYVLRSANAAYRPLLTLGLLALAATYLHRGLRRSERAGWRSSASAYRALEAAGATLAGVGVLALVWPALSEWIGARLPDSSALGFAWLPISLTAGFALLAYTTFVTAGAAAGPAGTSFPPRWYPLVVLTVLSLFWSVSLFAVHTGTSRAQTLHRTLRSLPEAVVLSPQLLTIRGPGIELVELELPERLRGQARYRFSYTGLRLLAHADGKHFLLPAAWRRGRDRVFEVPDDGRVRLELIAH
jgi:hypothetical protein